MRKKKSDKVFLLLFLFRFFPLLSIDDYFSRRTRDGQPISWPSCPPTEKRGGIDKRWKLFLSLFFKSPAHFSLFQKIYSHRIFFLKEKKASFNPFNKVDRTPFLLEIPSFVLNKWPQSISLMMGNSIFTKREKSSLSLTREKKKHLILVFSREIHEDVEYSTG